MSGVSSRGGVQALGSDRIQFMFTYKGKLYRPSLAHVPTEANLRRARLRLKAINARIREGAFSFSEEFPDSRFMSRLDEAKAETA